MNNKTEGEIMNRPGGDVIRDNRCVRDLSDGRILCDVVDNDLTLSVITLSKYSRFPLYVHVSLTRPRNAFSE